MPISQSTINELRDTRNVYLTNLEILTKMKNELALQEVQLLKLQAITPTNSITDLVLEKHKIDMRISKEQIDHHFRTFVNGEKRLLSTIATELGV